uniref:Tetratricopeptide repeat-containing protein n=1 Tax=Candidatus Kentrum eta TaxID=2126337 RepID=A0A450VFX4_9GAMM|nr:MAG: Tetratricopeptide repeat-containing protein [Candidatus Kentron sp. H]VFK03665.1 MAG: Tetratricopeptide repeat-containing protein [Candidatus Kentron sp. H]VFK06438.1 MAG: Tetratricopeptide repeat-containing protein [Candidatus Kentron sp. H]
MDFTMSLALWVSAGLAVLSLLAAISTKATVRLEGAENDKAHIKNDTMGNLGPDAVVNSAHGAIDARESAVKVRENTVANLEEEDPVVAPRVTNVVSTILSGAVKSEFDSVRSESYKEKGREHIHQWDIVFSRGEWNWDLLNQALECYVSAIRCNFDDQHAWVNLAFVYHLIGDKDKALECLEKSNTLACPGLYEPHRGYQQVERAINGNATLLGEKLDRPSVPAQFQDRYENAVSTFLRAI